MGEYFRRRFLRIYPPLWCAVLFSAVFCVTVNQVYYRLLEQSPWPLITPHDLSVAQWLGCLTLSSTWLCYLTGEAVRCFPGQSWTLCYEEQFYAVIGLLFAFSGTRFFQAVTVLTIAVLELDISVLIFDFPVAGFFFDEHWFMFAAGIGVYWKLNCATPRQSAVFQTILIAAAVGLTILASTTSMFGNGTHFSAFRVVGALVFAQILISLKRFDERIAELSWLDWLKRCGVMCYSIYLIHLYPGKMISQYMWNIGLRDDLSILFICIPLALVTAVSLGYLFHIFVERRFLTSRLDKKTGVAPQGQPPVITIPFEPGRSPSFDQARAAAEARKNEQQQVLKSQSRKVA